MNQNIIRWISKNKIGILVISILMTVIFLQWQEITNMKKDISDLYSEVAKNEDKLVSLAAVTDGDLENTDHLDWNLKPNNLETYVYYMQDDITRICKVLDISCN